MNFDFNIAESLCIIVALLVAVIGHEIMHGYAAFCYGDTTAKSLGRLSINPIVHIDVLGSILLPAILYFSGAPFLFGWAKPVPINYQKVFHTAGYNALSIVAAAGIFYNLILAVCASLLLQNFAFDGLIMSFLAQLLLINVVLAVVNAWPIPPLDGSWIISYQCSRFGFTALQRFYERIGMYGMIALVVILAVDPLRRLFFTPAIWLLEILA